MPNLMDEIQLFIVFRGKQRKKTLYFVRTNEWNKHSTWCIRLACSVFDALIHWKWKRKKNETQSTKWKRTLRRVKKWAFCCCLFIFMFVDFKKLLIKTLHSCSLLSTFTSIHFRFIFRLLIFLFSNCCRAYISHSILSKMTIRSFWLVVICLISFWFVVTLVDQIENTTFCNRMADQTSHLIWKWWNC